uniref:FH2 domain-containing protein n=1 Tax=Syphacia muris TaxID=451379 RepID=A0A0N5A7Y6_9BILA
MTAAIQVMEIRRLLEMADVNEAAAAVRNLKLKPTVLFDAGRKFTREEASGIKTDEACNTAKNLTKLVTKILDLMALYQLAETAKIMYTQVEKWVLDILSRCFCPPNNENSAEASSNTLASDSPSPSFVIE